jgi:hypothetical protein
MRPFRFVARIRLLLGFALIAAMVSASLTPAIASETDEPIHFTNDVLPWLSKLGCNSGGCHGKAIGQNGFKLSLYGFDPAFDYAALVHEGRGRRISPAAPQESLLLQKPTGELAHGGGLRLAIDSEPYQLLHRWIEQGMPWGDDDAPREVRLEVSPATERIEGPGERQLRVVVHYSDGSQRDVTKVARYDSQQPEILSASPEGLVTTTGERGEGYVMIRYGNLATTASVLLPLGPPLPDDAYADFAPKNFVDEFVLAKWRELHIAPSAEADDASFMRRLYLDVLGTLPEPDEIREFLADQSPDKRDALVDRVLERPEYADYWTLRWGDILRNQAGEGNIKDNTIAFAKWIHQSLAENKPYDQFVREILTVAGKRSDHPQMDWWRQAISNPVRVEDSSQAFLGMRVSCANCHNHPFENVSQTDYWQFAAFFSRVDSPTYGSVDEIKVKEEGEVKHPRTEKPLAPKAFNGPEFEVAKGEDPREKLVDWMVADDNPYFAPALVNRLWGHFFGVGLVDPVDDMRATNPPSNPELLNALARDFLEHKFDMKHAMRVMLKSRVYGLNSLPTDHNQADKRNYARHYPRRLAPHVLYDALSSATGVPTKFDDYPDAKRAIQLPNEKARSEFLDMFGRSTRDTPCECGEDIAPNLGQVLYLLHSDELQNKLSKEEGHVARWMKEERSNEQIVEEAFLRTFSRLPTSSELEDAVQLLEMSSDRRAIAEDLLWTLMNSKEFLFNH